MGRRLALAILTLAWVIAIAAPTYGQTAGGAVPTTPTGAAGAATTAGVEPKSLWSFLGIKKKKPGQCREKLCKHPLYRLLGGFLQPVALATGGLINPLCPPDAANPSDLAKAATSSEGAASRIKQDTAEAKARRAAIKYLATVDCRRWPEAEVALISGLRADRNECVRYEAANAFGRGCCCTKKVVEALKICVEQSEKDGNPAENSPRVLAAAEAALESCLACMDPTGAESPPPERPRRPEAPAPRAPAEQPPPPTPVATRLATPPSTVQPVSMPLPLRAEPRNPAPETRIPDPDPPWRRTYSTGKRSLGAILKHSLFGAQQPDAKGDSGN